MGSALAVSFGCQVGGNAVASVSQAKRKRYEMTQLTSARPISDDDSANDSGGEEHERDAKRARKEKKKRKKVQTAAI